MENSRCILDAQQGLSSQLTRESDQEGSENPSNAPDSEVTSFSDTRDSTQTDEFSENGHLTLRGVVVGSVIGTIFACSNMYFGLQTGWISGFAIPSSLIGFATFNLGRSYIGKPLKQEETVLIQTVAGAVGTMPLGGALLGAIPALQFLLNSSEGPLLIADFWELSVWASGVCLFGSVFAILLRRRFIIQDKLKFPSATATSLVIGILHGDSKAKARVERDTRQSTRRMPMASRSFEQPKEFNGPFIRPHDMSAMLKSTTESGWQSDLRSMLQMFSISAAYTLIQYFFPALREIPVFGSTCARTWLWTLNASPAYVGQGMIMGPITTANMLLGSIVGWGILSPVAKGYGWAPGPVNDWRTGSKGWILWISLAIMLTDSIVNLGWIIIQQFVQQMSATQRAPQSSNKSAGTPTSSSVESRADKQPWQSQGDFELSESSSDRSALYNRTGTQARDENADAPEIHQISDRTILILLPLVMILCFTTTYVVFGSHIPLLLIIFAVVIAMSLSALGVRALGETDLNPVSGIAKLSQAAFAIVSPSGIYAGQMTAIILLVGAISEAGILQAGSLISNFKIGHLTCTSPRAQLYGHLIGSLIGALISAGVYQLYVTVYEVPGAVFQVPSAYTGITTARLLQGTGAPPMAAQFAIAACVLFTVTTVVRLMLNRSSNPSHQKFRNAVPSAIAVAVGMYTTPNFILARAAGGMLSWWWTDWRGKDHTRLIVLASGLLLGEGLMSIPTLIMAYFKVPHL